MTWCFPIYIGLPHDDAVILGANTNIMACDALTDEDKFAFENAVIFDLNIDASELSLVLAPVVFEYAVRNRTSLGNYCKGLYTFVVDGEISSIACSSCNHAFKHAAGGCSLPLNKCTRHIFKVGAVFNVPAEFAYPQTHAEIQRKVEGHGVLRSGG